MTVQVSWAGVALSAVFVAGAVVSGIFHVEMLPGLLAGAAAGMFVPSAVSLAQRARD